MLDTVSETVGQAPAVFDSEPAKTRITRLAICGSNPHTKHTAPFHDPECLIYACSPDNSPYGDGPGKGPLPRVDQFFELHAPLEHISRPAAYLTWVASLPFVWMRDARALQSGVFKGAHPYPEQQLFGTMTKLRDGSVVPTGDGMFCPQLLDTSSVARMIAKAIVDCLEQNIPNLGLFGILQSSKEEFKSQRAGTQYMIWEARKRGINLHVAPESKLLEGATNEW
jgi:hypothetical protein